MTTLELLQQAKHAKSAMALASPDVKNSALAAMASALEENAAAILGRNVLGWFDREPGPDGRKYLYRVNQKGLEALALYENVL